MVEYFEYPTWQVKNHVRWGERFIIIRGPRFAGKSHFIHAIFEELQVPYLYIDVAGIRKIKAPRTNFFETVKKDLNRLHTYTKTNIPDLRFPNCRYVRCFLKQLEDREEHIYVIFDHAELLHPWETYGRVFKGEIDMGEYVHLVFVPASTSLLIQKMRIYDPDAPLFARWEKYVDIEYWGAREVKNYLENTIQDIDENEVWYVYKITEGAQQLVIKYAEYRKQYSKKESVEKLKEYVRVKVLEEVSGSEWKYRILKAIAEETHGERYTRLKSLLQIFDNYNQKTVSEEYYKLLDTGFIGQMGQNIYLKPRILSSALSSYLTGKRPRILSHIFTVHSIGKSYKTDGKHF